MKQLGKFAWSGDSVVTHLGYHIVATRRQRDVLLLLCEGLPNKLIARQLGLFDNTVKTHVASVLRSLHAATRLEAVGIAFKLGLVQPAESGALNGSVARGFLTG
jgi:DNA-binding NarL/FixJ family response regulator